MSGIWPRDRFVVRHLDPGSRLGEVLFGLIMVLCATLTTGVAAVGDPDGARELLYAAIGCNVAWGLIDAVMYVMGCMTARAGVAGLIRSIRASRSRPEALELVRRDLGSRLEVSASERQTEELSRACLDYLSASEPPPIWVLGDFFGAFACFWLVFLSCLPAALPFLLIAEPAVALRVSNLLLIGMLFAVGYKWASHAGTSRLLSGLVMVAIGLLLVGTAVVLGG